MAMLMITLTKTKMRDTSTLMASATRDRTTLESHLLKKTMKKERIKRTTSSQVTTIAFLWMAVSKGQSSTQMSLTAEAHPLTCK